MRCDWDSRAEQPHGCLEQVRAAVERNLHAERTMRAVISQAIKVGDAFENMPGADLAAEHFGRATREMCSELVGYYATHRKTDDDAEGVTVVLYVAGPVDVESLTFFITGQQVCCERGFCASQGQRSL